MQTGRRRYPSPPNFHNSSTEVQTRVSPSRDFSVFFQGRPVLEGGPISVSPYVYQYKHGILHKTRGWRIPNIEEREAMMFFPINYTFYCCTKTVRKQSLQEWEDIRMSLIGNSWHVGVVSFLLQELLSQHQLLEHVSLHQLLNKLRPGSSTSLGELLFRPGFAKRQPFQPVFRNLKQEQQLVTRICHLVSTKGTDVWLKSSTESDPQKSQVSTKYPPKPLELERHLRLVMAFRQSRT